MGYGIKNFYQILLVVIKYLAIKKYFEKNNLYKNNLYKKVINHHFFKGINNTLFGRYVVEHTSTLFDPNFDKIINKNDSNNIIAKSKNEYLLSFINNKNKNIFSTGNVYFTYRLFLDNDINILIKNVINYFNYISSKSELIFKSECNDLIINIKKNYRFDQLETIHVIILLYTRPKNFQKILKSLENQTINKQIHLHIINNNLDNKDKISKVVENSKLKITENHFNNENYCFERFYYAKKLIKKYKHIDYLIFIDDDHLYENDWIENLYNLRKPEHFIAWYTKVFDEDNLSYFTSLLNYTDTCNNTNNKYKYCHYGGPGGSIIDSNIFNNDELFNLPDEKYKYIDDIWLSYILTKNNWIIKRSFLAPTLISDKDTTEHALYDKIKNYKNDIFMDLINNKGWALH